MTENKYSAPIEEPHEPEKGRKRSYPLIMSEEQKRRYLRAAGKANTKLCYWIFDTLDKALAEEQQRPVAGRCGICNSELAYCGELDEDGVPSLDCLVCRLRAQLQDLNEQLDIIAAEKLALITEKVEHARS